MKKRILWGMAAPIVLLSFALAALGCDNNPSQPPKTDLEGEWVSRDTTLTVDRDSFTLTSFDGLGIVDDVAVKGTFTLNKATGEITLTIKQFSMDNGRKWQNLTENNLIDAMAIEQVGQAVWDSLTSAMKQTYRDQVKEMLLFLGDISIADMINEMKTQIVEYELDEEEYKLTLTFDGETMVFYLKGHEPAGSGRGSTVTLTENNWKDGAITDAIPEAWYSFPALAGTTYYVWWNESDPYYGTGDGSKTLDVKVTGYYGENTTSIAGFDETDSAWTTAKSFTPDQTGMVYLKVAPYYSGRTGTFGIVYSTANTRPGVPRPISIPLTADEWANGSISATNGTAWYSFDVVAGTTYNVWWNDSDAGDGSKTADVSVTGFYDESEAAITNFNNVDSAWTTPRSITPGESHKVYLRVTPYSAGSTGTFGIVYSTTNARPWATPENSTPLTMNQWENGSIDSSHPAVWYTFNVSAGQTYYVWLNDSDATGGGKTLDAAMTGYYNGNITPITGFSTVDVAWTTPVSFTPTESTTVYLRVASYYSSGTGTGTFGVAYNDANTRPFIQLATAPATPGAPTATAMLLGGINVSWNSVTGAEEYILWRTTESASGTYTQIKTTEWNVTSYMDDAALDAATTYFYKVAAKNSSGTSDLSNASTGRAGVAKATIIPLTADTWADGDIPSTGVREQWFSFTATAETQYIHAYFGTLNDLYVQLYNADLTMVGTQSELYSYSTDFANVSRTVTIGQEYYIRVTPYYSTGNGTYQIAFNDSSEAPFVQLTTAPAAPSTPTATAWPIVGGIAVSWNSVVGAEEYDVYRATGSPTATFTVIIGTTDRLTTSYLDDTATNTTLNYYYRIVAKNSVGESAQSNYSAVRVGVAAATVTPLTENTWADGNIPATGVREEWFSFTATVSGMQYIHGAHGTLNDWYVQMYDANGATVGSQQNIYSTLYTSRSVTSGQEYYIRVTPYYSSSGTYKIAFNTSSTAPAP